MAILTGDLDWEFVESVNGLSGIVTLTAEDVGAYGASNIHEALIPIDVQSGAAYTAILANQGGVIRFTSASAVAFTVPDFASVAYPVGATISGVQYAAGQITINPAGGVTINTEVGLKTTAQFSYFTLLNVGEDEWLLTGSLSA